MASWVVHFRVGDYFLDKISDIDEKNFIVGNIGPDCGEPNEDWTAFNPPKIITHWENDDKTINAEKFYEAYIKDKDFDKNHRSFYLGYYVHLLTDILWKRDIGDPTKEKWEDGFKIYGHYEMWDKIKTDWYDLDHLYLKKNSDFYSYKVFKKLRDYNNDYLPYYSKTAIPNQIKFINEFYSEQHENLERDYEYLTEEKMNAFVDKAHKEIKDILKNKGTFA